MEEITAVAAAETINILYNTEISLIAKIPYFILKTLEDKALECQKEIKLNMELSLDKQNISDEARTILSIIYKDYWCDNETKTEMDRIFADKIKEYEEEQKANLDPFKDSIKANSIEEIKKVDNESLVIVPQKWYIRIFKKVIRFFRKK